VEDVGKPSSYLMLAPGPPVYTSDGERVGKVEHVLADQADDIFDGIVLDTSVLPGGQRFVDAEQVEEIYERGVVLKIDRAAAERLPEPSENAAAMEVTADDLSQTDSSELKRKLGRAWDLISGK
jgi:sporulation protein YlmC with PRC-barrel domain